MKIGNKFLFIVDIVKGIFYSIMLSAIIDNIPLAIAIVGVLVVGTKLRYRIGIYIGLLLVLISYLYAKYHDNLF